LSGVEDRSTVRTRGVSQRDEGSRAVLKATLQLPPRTASVPQARRFVLNCLAEWSLEHLCETTALLVSEVVSNSVLHARTEIVVTAARLGSGVEVQVSDLSQVAPVQRRHSSDATTGRGVQLLDQLASSWEVLPRPEGKTVRFTVEGGTDPWAAFRDGAWQDVEL
jgi:anti-sigma regulatory factor (Ser/Thr protein kinase)